MPLLSASILKILQQWKIFTISSPSQFSIFFWDNQWEETLSPSKRYFNSSSLDFISLKAFLLQSIKTACQDLRVTLSMQWVICNLHLSWFLISSSFSSPKFLHFLWRMPHFPQVVFLSLLLTPTNLLIS